MKKTILLFVIVYTATFLSGSLVTLEDALESALQNNPELLAAESDMLAARSSMQSSYLDLGPSANLNYTKSYQNPGMEQMPGIVLDETSSYGLTATQPIFNGGKVILSTQMAKNTYNMMKATYKAKVLEIKAETEKKYFSVQSNLELMKALEKTLQQSVINLTIAKAKLDAGLLSRAEYLQMESEKLSSELDLINMRNALELSKLALGDYIGQKSDIKVTEFDLSSYKSILTLLQDMDFEKQNVLTETFLKLGKNNNPTLRISALSVSTAEKSKMMAAGNFLPSFNLSYSYNWDNTNLEEDYSSSSSLVLSASMPIFPIADNALEYQAAKQELSSQQSSHTSIGNSIMLSIRSSALQLYTSARAVESARLSNEAAWESWQQMRERFEQGLISSGDLLSAEVMVISADNNYITAKQDFLTAISGLLQMTGLEKQTELIKIINGLEDK